MLPPLTPLELVDSGFGLLVVPVQVDSVLEQGCKHDWHSLPFELF